MSGIEGSSPRVPRGPFLLGDVVITAIALTLLWQNWDDLGSMELVAAVVCLAVGALLFAIPYALDYKTLRLLARLDANQAGMNVAAALERTGALVDRLEDLERKRDASAILTEKLPELIEERLERFVEQSLEHSRSAHHELVAATADPLIASLGESLATANRVVIDSLTAETQAILRKMEALEAQTTAANANRDALQSLATAQEELKNLLREVGEKVRSSPVARPKAPAPLPVRPLVQPRPQTMEPPLPPGPTSLEEEEVPEEPVEVPPAKEEKAPRPVSRSRPRESRLVITAFVGISNKIYLRGEAGGLSREEGTPLEMTGIGEWNWSATIEEPLELEVWLNDTIPAANNPVVLNPGETVAFQPNFP